MVSLIANCEPRRRSTEHDPICHRNFGSMAPGTIEGRQRNISLPIVGKSAEDEARLIVGRDDGDAALALLVVE